MDEFVPISAAVLHPLMFIFPLWSAGIRICGGIPLKCLKDAVERSRCFWRMGFPGAASQQSPLPISSCGGTGQLRGV